VKTIVLGSLTRFVRVELPVIVQVLSPRSVTFAVLVASVVMAPVSCEPVAVKVVAPDDTVFSSTPLPLVIDDPLTAISAIAPCTWNASAAEVTVALLI
jgi:hypothetical protein